MPDLVLQKPQEALECPNRLCKTSLKRSSASTRFLKMNLEHSNAPLDLLKSVLGTRMPSLDVAKAILSIRLRAPAFENEFGALECATRVLTARNPVSTDSRPLLADPSGCAPFWLALLASGLS